MKAVMAIDIGKLSLGELEIPKPGEYEALVRMDACAICNSTDLKLLKGEFFSGSFPMVLGHEVISTVVELGTKVVNFQKGDRVFRQMLKDSHVPGEGRSCWGGFAQFGIVTDEWAKRNLAFEQNVLPHAQQKLLVDIEPVPATTMITLMETLDCVMSCGASPGKSVAIVGSGPVGQAFALFARLLGGAPVYVFGRSRRYADRFAQIIRCDGYIVGEDYPSEVKKVIEGGGFDVVIEAVGSEAALGTCIRIAGSSGHVFVYGIAPESHGFQEKQLKNPRVKQVGAVEGRAQRKLAGFLEAGMVSLDQWYSDVFPLDDYQTAFDKVEEKKALKAVLTN
jgi:threonine dehydrogenase-like Zn-dependent dehydrogenase